MYNIVYKHIFITLWSILSHYLPHLTIHYYVEMYGYKPCFSKGVTFVTSYLLPWIINPYQKSKFFLLRADPNWDRRQKEKWCGCSLNESESINLRCMVWLRLLQGRWLCHISICSITLLKGYSQWQNFPSLKAKFVPLRVAFKTT